MVLLALSTARHHRGAYGPNSPNDNNVDGYNSDPNANYNEDLGYNTYNDHGYGDNSYNDPNANNNDNSGYNTYSDPNYGGDSNYGDDSNYGGDSSPNSNYGTNTGAGDGAGDGVSTTTTNSIPSYTSSPTSSSASNPQSSSNTQSGSNPQVSSNTQASSTPSSSSSSTSTSSSGPATIIGNGPYFTNFIQECLDIHNQERNSLGLTSLTWNADLATTSQTWADYLASIGSLIHSPNRVHIGENLAYRTYHNGIDSTPKLIQGWLDEKQYFINGRYPDISTTGNVEDVGHYSQIVWRNTKELGCALSRNNGDDYMVCQYGPSGNWEGEQVY
jgi:uncharacterized protein YkwD